MHGVYEFVSLFCLTMFKPCVFAEDFLLQIF